MSSIMAVTSASPPLGSCAGDVGVEELHLSLGGDARRRLAPAAWRFLRRFSIRAATRISGMVKTT